MQKKLGAPGGALLAAAVLLSIAGPTPAAAIVPEHREIAASADRPVIVSLRANDLTPLRERQEALLQRIGRDVDGSVTLYQYVDGLSLSATPEEIARLRADPQVASVDEDLSLTPAGTAAAPGIEYNIYLPSQSTEIIGAKRLWRDGVRGAGWSIAILDTGLRTESIPLNDRVVEETCFSTNSGPNVKSLCPGGASSSTAAGSGEACTLKGCEHGSQLAHVAAGDPRGQGTATSEVGVARDSSLISIQVASRHNAAVQCRPDPAPCVRVRANDLVRGLEYLFRIRNERKIAAAVVSLSQGAYDKTCDNISGPMTQIVKKLKGAGILVVAAAGDAKHNDKIGFPACISDVVSAGSTGKIHSPQQFVDKVPESTNMAPFMTLMGPGDNFRTAFGNVSGSSLGAAHVAGSIALVRSAKPRLPLNTLLSNLVCTGELVARVAKPDNKPFVAPRVSPGKAVDRLREPNTPLVENFSGTGGEVGWVSLLGKWGKKNGGFYSLLETNSRAAVVGYVWSAAGTAICGSSFEVRANIKRVQGRGADYNTAVVLGDRIPSRTGDLIVSGYFFSFNKQGGTRTQVLRLDNYNFTTVSGGYTVLCDNKTTFTFGDFIILNFRRKGNSLNAGVGSLGVCNVTDATYKNFNSLIVMAAHPPGPALRNTT